jgi:hypothetical protein
MRQRFVMRELPLSQGPAKSITVRPYASISQIEEENGIF